MKINIFNINFFKRRFVKKALNQIISDLQINDKDLEVNIIVTDENQIKWLNNEYRKIDKVTDVLSFPMLDLCPGQKIDYEKYKLDLNSENDTLSLGDIYICKKRANDQAKECGHSTIREYCFLSCHGLLHLLGYDHLDEITEKEMNDIIENALNKIKVTRKK